MINDDYVYWTFARFMSKPKLPGNAEKIQDAEGSAGRPLKATTPNSETWQIIRADCQIDIGFPRERGHISTEACQDFDASSR